MLNLGYCDSRSHFAVAGGDSDAFAVAADDADSPVVAAVAVAGYVDLGVFPSHPLPYLRT